MFKLLDSKSFVYPESFGGYSTVKLVGKCITLTYKSDENSLMEDYVSEYKYKSDLEAYEEFRYFVREYLPNFPKA